MMPSLKTFWIIIGIIWLTAMGLTHWNGIKIDTITTLRDTNEQLRGELHFGRRNAARLTQVVHTHESFYFPVASVALGLVETKSLLHSLAAVFDLKQTNIKDELNQAADNSVPITISAQGSIDKILTFLTTLQKYPHLPVVQTHIRRVDESDRVEATISLVFQFTTTATEQLADNPLQVNNLDLFQGESRL